MDDYQADPSLNLNIVPPSPVAAEQEEYPISKPSEANQSSVPSGLDAIAPMGQIPRLQSLDTQFANLDKLLENQGKQMSQVPWFQLAAAFLNPGKSGSFGEALGGASGTIGKWQEQQAANQIPLAKARLEINQQRYSLAQQMQDALAAQKLASSLGQSTGTSPQATRNFATLQSEYQDAANKFATESALGNKNTASIAEARMHALAKELDFAKEGRTEFQQDREYNRQVSQFDRTFGQNAFKNYQDSVFKRLQAGEGIDKINMERQKMIDQGIQVPPLFSNMSNLPNMPTLEQFLGTSTPPPQTKALAPNQISTGLGSPNAAPTNAQPQNPPTTPVQPSTSMQKGVKTQVAQTSSIAPSSAEVPPSPAAARDIAKTQRLKSEEDYSARLEPYTKLFNAENNGIQRSSLITLQKALLDPKNQEFFGAFVGPGFQNALAQAIDGKPFDLSNLVATSKIKTQADADRFDSLKKLFSDVVNQELRSAKTIFGARPAVYDIQQLKDNVATAKNSPTAIRQWTERRLLDNNFESTVSKKYNEWESKNPNTSKSVFYNQIFVPLNDKHIEHRTALMGAQYQ